MTGQPGHPGVRKTVEIAWEEGPSAPFRACILSPPTCKRYVILRDQRVNIKVRFCIPFSARFLKSKDLHGFPYPLAPGITLLC